MKACYAAVCCMVKDEPDLREWAAFHLAVGFDHLLIYDNESAVPVSMVLEDHVAQGRATVLSVKGRFQQCASVYVDALARTRTRCRWLAFIDADEFILPHQTDDIRHYLGEREEWAGLAANWQIFGDSYHDLRPEGMVMENYRWRGGDDYEENRHLKWIANPQDILWPHGPHSFHFRDERKVRHGDGHELDCHPVDRRAFQFPPAVSYLQINHYYTRSAEDFHAKQRRGGGNGVSSRGNEVFERIRQNCNAVYDSRITRFRSRTIEMNAAEFGSLARPGSRVGPRQGNAQKTLVFRIMPPGPPRSEAALASHSELVIRDLPPIKAADQSMKARERAASLAHASVMKAFLETDADFAVVLEDDAILDPDQNWLSFTDYDFFVPFSHNRESRPPDSRIRVGVVPDYGAFAYLCSRTFAARYLPRLLAGEIADHAPHRAYAGLRIASFVGNLVNHDNGSPSMISEERRRHFNAGAPNRKAETSGAAGTGRILIGICSCAANAEKRQAIRDTWLPADSKLVAARFFVGTGGEATPDTLCVPAPDTYESLPEKVIAFFRVALEEFEFDWLLKCDDDTYVVTARLADLLGEVDLVGNEFLLRSGTRQFASGGAGYLLSRAMVQNLVQDRSMLKVGPEDVIISQAAVAAGARWQSTARLRYDDLKTPLLTNDLITAHRISVKMMHEVHADLQGLPVLKNRSQILQWLIKHLGHQSYLEVGVRGESLFRSIDCPVKVRLGEFGEDLSAGAPLLGVTLGQSLDMLPSTFDLIFIDGQDSDERARLALQHAFAHLNPGGTIVCHGLNPSIEDMQKAPRKVLDWTGDSWKAWVGLRAIRDDLLMAVVDVDYGVGVIRSGPGKKLDLAGQALTWQNLTVHRTEWLNLVGQRGLPAALDLAAPFARFSVLVVTLWRAGWSATQEAVMRYLCAEEFPLETRFVWTVEEGSETAAQLETHWQELQGRGRGYSLELAKVPPLPSGSSLAKHLTVAALYNRALQSIEAPWVLTVEDDVVAKAGSFQKLQAFQASHWKCVAAMGAYESRAWPGCLCASEAGVGYPAWHRVESDEWIEASWLGTGLTLYAGPALKKCLPAAAKVVKGSVHGWNREVSAALQRAGGRLLVDTQCRADHRFREVPSCVAS